MFTNLIESDPHRKEFKRRSSFFLATVAAYAVILFAAGVGSIYAYDAHLEAQNTDLLVDYWLPPIAAAPADQPHVTQAPSRTVPNNAPVDPNITTPERTERVSSLADPRSTPDDIGVNASLVTPVLGPVNLTSRNVNPPGLPSANQNTCVTCTGNDSGSVRVPVEEAPPVLVPVKPPTQNVSKGVLLSHAVSLPQPPYPQLAKQIRAHGPVSVQILVDEQGKVISAQAVSGHPMLLGAARDAALRARFTPTTLSGQAVKVQGVITYNFVLQ